MGTFLSTWGFRIGMAAAAIGGGAIGYGVNSIPEDDPDPIVRQYDEAADPPRMATIHDGSDPKDTEEDPFEAGPQPGGDLSYEINAIGRQVAGPLTQVVTEPIGNLMEAKGAYKMRYVDRVQAGKDPNTIYGDQLSRDIFSRSKWLGRTLRTWGIDEEHRGHPLSDPAEQKQVRRTGASLSSHANYIFVTQHLVRFGTNLIAIHEMTNGTESNLTMAEKGVVFADTASVASHSVDIGLYGRGLSQISRGNDVRAISTLSMSHRINILSNSLQIAAGALRLYAELERQEETGKSNPSSMFYSLLDMGNGVCYIIFSLFLLNALRRLRKEQKQPEDKVEEKKVDEADGAEAEAANEEKAEATPEEKQGNVLLGITKWPPFIQDSMRLITAFGASAAAGVNSSNMASVLGHPAMSEALRDTVTFSSSLGIGGSLFALGASFFIKPGTYPVARLLFAGSSVLIAVQTLNDFWPSIMQILGVE